MNISKLKISLGTLPLLALLACQQGPEAEAPGAADKSLQFDMSGVGRTTVSNTEVYVFDGQGAAQGQFNHKVLNIDRAGDRLSMNVPQGRWDLFLLSADPNVRADIQSPVRGGGDRAGQKMVEFGAWDSSEPFKVQVPEVRTARIDGQVINANQQQTVSATLARNAAMIKVVVADVTGVEDGYSFHEFQLRNVPNALSWSGSLWPDKDSPQAGADPMRLPVVISTDPATGRQHSDTMTFIVPAHVGTDYLATSPADTSTHKLSVMLRLYNGTNYITKEAELPLVPKANKIIVARLFVKSDLTFQTTIEDWEDTEMDAEFGQTALQVSKANVGLAWKDTVYVKASKSLTITSEAGWLTAQAIDAERVELTGNVDDYDSPRFTYVNFTAGNVTKRVRVDQRPDRGTINFRPKRVVLSPVHPSKGDVFVDCPQYNEWKLFPSEKVTPSPAMGTGDYCVTLTRKTSENDLSAYGNEFYTVRNMVTLDTSRIELCNLFLDAPDEIYVGNPMMAMDTTVWNDEITALGASGRFKVESKPDWVTEVTVENDGRLKIVAQRDPQEEAREGMMTIMHLDDPDYKMQVKVIQDVIVRIPEFDYFTLKFNWRNNDVDIAVQFADNGVPFDNKPVGWYMYTINGTGSSENPILYNGQKLLEWGGDATGGQGETAFFNAPVVNSDPTLPRRLNLDAYAAWYTSGRAPDTMGFTMYAYKGGFMQKAPDGKNYINVGGVMVYSQRFTVMIDKYSGSSIAAQNFRNTYTYVARLVYDRVKHSARVDLKATPSTLAVPVPYRRPEREEQKPKPQ